MITLAKGAFKIVKDDGTTVEHVQIFDSSTIHTNSEVACQTIILGPSSGDTVVDITHMQPSETLYITVETSGGGTAQTVDVKLNGATTAFTVNEFMLLVGAITSISIGNPDVTDSISVTVIAAA